MKATIATIIVGLCIIFTVTPAQATQKKMTRTEFNRNLRRELPKQGLNRRETRCVVREFKVWPMKKLIGMTDRQLLRVSTAIAFECAF